MVEMKVFGLAMDEKTNVPVLVLKDDAKEQSLPIWIGAMEAMAISLVLNEVALPRPMTHDLLLNMAHGLGGKISRVEITRLEEGTYYAEIVVMLQDDVRRIDSRPSDAVALALRADCPILVAGSVLESVSKEAAAAAGPLLKTDEADKWSELLDDLSEDDSKYKM